MPVYFACVCGLLAAVSLSADDGVAWKNIGPGGGGWIQSMLASRHGSNTFFVGCDVGGFYRSDDGGAIYTIHNAGFEDYFVECLAEHPTDPRTLYAGCRSGVYKSTDGGTTWRWLRNGFPKPQAYAYSAPISKVVLDPLNPEIVYAAIGEPRGERGGRGTIYKSEDGGASWRQIVRSGQLAPDLLICDLAVNPRNPRRMLIATPKGVFASDDGGATWALSSDGLPEHRRTRRLAQSPSDPRIVYVSLKGLAGEAPWQAGVYRSDDGGRTWRARNTGFRKTAGRGGESDMMCSWVDALAVHPQLPDTVYAGGAAWVDATVYKTTDGGGHWSRAFEFGEKGNARRAWISMWGPHVTCLSLAPTRPDTVYFGTSGFIYETTDGGVTWHQRYTQERADSLIAGGGLEVTCLHGVFPHPRVRGRLFCGFYDVGLLVTEDGGATFRRCMRGIPGSYDNSCFTVAFAEDDDARVWAGFGQWGSNRGTLAESRDNGASWTLLRSPTNGVPDAAPGFLIAERDAASGQHRLFYVAKGLGVWASADSGATWAARNAGLPEARVSCLACDAEHPAVFYAGVSGRKDEAGAVFRSDDRCATWRLVGGAEFPEVRQIAASGGRVFVTARGAQAGGRYREGGVFRSGDGGVTWSHVYTNRFCEALALDPRRPARVYASLHDHPYHDCSTGGGVIASEDGGTTWRSLASPSLTCKGVTWIATDPFEDARLWLGTAGNAIFTGVVGCGGTGAK